VKQFNSALIGRHKFLSFISEIVGAVSADI